MMWHNLSAILNLAELCIGVVYAVGFAGPIIPGVPRWALFGGRLVFPLLFIGFELFQAADAKDTPNAR